MAELPKDRKLQMSRLRRQSLPQCSKAYNFLSAKFRAVKLRVTQSPEGHKIWEPSCGARAQAAPAPSLSLPGHPVQRPKEGKIGARRCLALEVQDGLQVGAHTESSQASRSLHFAFAGMKETSVNPAILGLEDISFRS